MSLRWRIDKIRDDPWWRPQTRSKEHRLCHRCRVILRHVERMGDIAALLLRRAGWQPFIYAIPTTEPISCGVWRYGRTCMVGCGERCGCRCTMREEKQVWPMRAFIAVDGARKRLKITQLKRIWLLTNAGRFGLPFRA